MKVPKILILPMLFLSLVSYIKVILNSVLFNPELRVLLFIIGRIKVNDLICKNCLRFENILRPTL